MKAALSLLEPEAGEAFFFGIPGRVTKSRWQAAYLPENFRPPPAMKEAQFVRLALGFHNLGFDRPQADVLARAPDLDPAALDARIATPSKGMAQKLGLLAVFLTDCPLLILDEPAGGLDPRARILLKAQIRSYRARNKAVFFSSHVLADLEEICDRIAVLHDGALRFTGPPLTCARSKMKLCWSARFFRLSKRRPLESE